MDMDISGYYPGIIPIPVSLSVSYQELDIQLDPVQNYIQYYPVSYIQYIS